MNYDHQEFDAPLTEYELRGTRAVFGCWIALILMISLEWVVVRHLPQSTVATVELVRSALPGI